MVISPFVMLFWIVLLLVSHGTSQDLHGEVLCLNKVCYSVHLAKISFNKAQQNCKNDGGNLVTIKTKEEAEHLGNLLMELQKSSLLNGPMNLWIGLQLKQCVVDDNLLKGFSWISEDQDPKEDQFSNWLQTPKRTCTANRCVALNFHLSSTDNYKWSDKSCANPADGYLCKFHFKGMCQRVAFAGPGKVVYTTPFSTSSTTLTLVPHGSMAIISCDNNNGKHQLICTEQTEYKFGWNLPGPFCFSPELGCAHNNGGCEHTCIKNQENGSIRCGCKEGYVLASDLVSCVLHDKCQPNPCEHNCINHLNFFECTCPTGFVLSDNKLNCTDIDECQNKPCNQTCSNIPGSFVCKCKEGFSSQDTSCIDLDECIYSLCEHGCLNTYGSYYCTCNEGFVIGQDRLSCLDVDECKNSPCESQCHNTNGGYKCSCPEGYSLSSDGISCNQDKESDYPTPSIIPTNNQSRDKMHHPTQSSDFQDLPKVEKPKESNGYPNTTMTPKIESFPDNDSVNPMQGATSDKHKLVLLVSIVCACIVLVLLAIVAGILCYRRNTSQKNKSKSPNATDNYSWVPDQSDNKAVANEYSTMMAK
ncbi:complement component C1q receptor [Bombina bombina]|uniref:complement component C1q receptor n=1 Tax=Bombina bombina TaxID=8345 RepID=UPI00235AE543|nr:complement component C1q receptor [Bombina bombina]